MHACVCLLVVVWITGDQRPERGMFLAIFHFLAIGEKLTEKLPASYGLALRLLKLLRLRLDCQQHLEWVSLDVDVDLDLDTRLGRCLCGDKAPNVQQACAGSNRHCHQGVNGERGIKVRGRGQQPVATALEASLGHIRMTAATAIVISHAANSKNKTQKKTKLVTGCWLLAVGNLQLATSRL